MAVEEPRGAGALGDGWFALRVGAWSRARELFEQQLAVEETAEALEGLGRAGHCLDDDALTFSARAGLPPLSRTGPGSWGARVARA